MLKWALPVRGLPGASGLATCARCPASFCSPPWAPLQDLVGQQLAVAGLLPPSVLLCANRGTHRRLHHLTLAPAACKLGNP